MEALTEEQQEQLATFCAITGADPGAATSVLAATNWQLEEAVNLQLATGGDLGGGGGGGGGPAAGRASSPPPDIPPELLGGEEEHVRAPMPVVRDRLYGDAMPRGLPPIARYGPPPPDRGPTHIDVFRDFNPAAGASSAAAGAGPSPSVAAEATRLSDMFKPPEGVFAGPWEAALAHAAKEGRWLLVNVQSADEFATHRLNRDTWGQDLVQDMLRGTFVFWQVYNSSDQGGQLIGKYHLDQLPATFIVDPVTGAKVWDRPGFISPDALLEELVPFMDAGPNDAGASALAHRYHEQQAKRRVRAASGPGEPGSGMSDEEQLALALAMSVEGGGGGAAGAAGAGPPSMRMEGEEEDELDEEAIWAEVQRRQAAEEAAKARGRSQAAAAPAAAAGAAAGEAGAAQQRTEAAAAAAAPAPDVASVQAAAATRLPPEPAEGAAGSCRVAFRLPDGSRAQRRFNASDPVGALHDYVLSVSPEAAGLPGGFALAEPRPGSAPLADLGTSIAAAGVAGAMLVIRQR